jgi:hypothetical protein
MSLHTGDTSLATISICSVHNVLKELHQMGKYYSYMHPHMQSLETHFHLLICKSLLWNLNGEEIFPSILMIGLNINFMNYFIYI